MLTVADCPSTAVLRARLTAVLAGQRDVRVTWREVTDEEEAVRWGTHGSPTLLVDGVDPFRLPGEEPSMSCRADGAPSVDRLREAIPVGRLAPEEHGHRAVQQTVLRAFATTGRPPSAAELDAAAAPFKTSADRILT